MVFIPPPHMMQGRNGKPASQHDLTVGMFVVFVIMLGIALFVFIAGPRSDNPPPLVVGYVVSVGAFIFGFISFLSWMREQGENPDDTHTNAES